MMLRKQYKLYKLLFFLVHLFSLSGVYEVVVAQMELSDSRSTQSHTRSVTVTNRMQSTSSRGIPTPTMTRSAHDRPFTSSEAVEINIKPTMLTSLSVHHTPSPSTTPLILNHHQPCKGVIFSTTASVVFLTTTVLLLFSTMILAIILLLTYIRLKRVQKECKTVTNAIFPDNSGVSHWISHDDLDVVPTLSDNLSSQNDTKKHNIWSLTTQRPMTFEPSSEQDVNGEIQSPDCAAGNSSSVNNRSPTSPTSKQKIKPKRKAPGPPIKPKKKHAKQPDPAGYIYPQSVCKQQQQQPENTQSTNNSHEYAVPHSIAATSWKSRLKKSLTSNKREYQGIDLSRVTPPGPYAEIIK